MLTNIDIDEDLIAEAMKLSGAKTKREMVDRALREVVARSQRTRFRDIWGTATADDYWPGYDPKAHPGEEPDRYRVEQVRPTYKVAPPAATAPARKPGKKR